MNRASEIRIAHGVPGFRLEIEAAWDAASVAIFGPSGAGKTSLLEIVAGIRRADRALVLLQGRLLEDHDAGFRLPAERRGLGWVPQESSLFPHLSVRENVRFGIGRATSEGAFARAIEMLEIGPLLDRYPRHLSGGERQRVALARALASGPSALLLDEPLASLDLPLRARIYPYLLRLRDESGLPILYVTHDAGEALGLARHVLVLDGGRIAASGRPEELLRSPAALRLLDLLGIENRLVVARIDPLPEQGLARLRTAGGLEIAVPHGLVASPGEVVGIRAEDILIATSRPDGISAQNILPGTVARLTDEGSRWIVTAGCGGEPVHAAITRHAADDLRLREGSAVWLVFKALAVHRLGG